MSGRSQEELREEHESIGNAMNAAKKEIDRLQDGAESWNPYVRDAALREMEKYEKDMDEARERQKKIYEEYKENEAAEEEEYYDEDPAGETNEIT